MSRQSSSTSLTDLWMKLQKLVKKLFVFYTMINQLIAKVQEIFWEVCIQRSCTSSHNHCHQHLLLEGTIVLRYISRNISRYNNGMVANWSQSIDCNTIRCTCHKNNLDCSPVCRKCRGAACANSKWLWSSVAEWLGCLTCFWSQTPNLKISGSIPHAITSANLDFHHCV